MTAILQDLDGLDELVAAQVAADVPRADVIDALCRSLLDRLSKHSTKLGNDVSAQLSRAINDAPFDSEQKQQLARAVLSIGEPKGKKKAKARANQKCHNLENFISEAMSGCLYV